MRMSRKALAFVALFGFAVGFSSVVTVAKSEPCTTCDCSYICQGDLARGTLGGGNCNPAYCKWFPTGSCVDACIP